MFRQGRTSIVSARSLTFTAAPLPPLSRVLERADTQVPGVRTRISLGQVRTAVTPPRASLRPLHVPIAHRAHRCSYMYALRAVSTRATAHQVTLETQNSEARQIAALEIHTHDHPHLDTRRDTCHYTAPAQVTGQALPAFAPFRHSSC